jgi:transcriptional regulator with XRE-family HTH domain
MSATSERLISCRKAMGISGTAASKAMGIMYKTINEYENGRKDPRASILIILAKFYGVSSDYLLGITDAKHSERWVPCKERLPAKDPCPVCVAIWSNGYKSWQKGYFSNGRFYVEKDILGVIEYQATHWRPDLETPEELP